MRRKCFQWTYSVTSIVKMLCNSFHWGVFELRSLGVISKSALCKDFQQGVSAKELKVFFKSRSRKKLNNMVM